MLSSDATFSPLFLLWLVEPIDVRLVDAKEGLVVAGQISVDARREGEKIYFWRH